MNEALSLKVRTFTALCSLVVLLIVANSAPAAQWYPLEVENWTPPFVDSRQRELVTYVPLDAAAQRWNICVSIPHLKDDYWLAVNYGLVNEAKRIGVNLAIYEAGGYENLDVQRKQIDDCVADPSVEGIIISAIAADGLAEQISAARARGLPVLDLINGINSADITARNAVDYYDMGYSIGEYLVAASEESDGATGVAWFPGPEGAGWVAAGDKGFRAALANSKLEILVTGWGDTSRAEQSRQLRTVLDDMGDTIVNQIGYVVGTAVTAEAATSILRSRGLTNRVSVLSYYYGPGVHMGIRRRSILASPTDSPVLQSRIAVDTMTRILEQAPYFKHVSPQVIVVDQANMRQWDSSTSLAPRGFRAIFSVEE